MSITPYGGSQLVDRTVAADEASWHGWGVRDLPNIQLTERILSDLYLIAVGALSPLTGFMDRKTYRSVLMEMSLPGGLPWTMPIVLPATGEELEGLRGSDRAALVAPDGEVAGMIEIEDVWERDVRREAQLVYGTVDTDEDHPGVASMRRLGDYYVAGPIRYLYTKDLSGFPDQHLTPAGIRAAIEERGWHSVAGFQTRNPIHRAHEYLLKCALELTDGLLVHPLVGETKDDDVAADVRMDCYRAILEEYFPTERVLLSVLPAAMRYAGPREAVHHAIMRRNYGCTHFIVGRDHAGVGEYYGTYDAQRIFDDLDEWKLGIRPLKFEHAFWCQRTGQMATAKTTPSGPDDRIFLSGTKVREMLSRGERPPAEFTRPEVADVLVEAYRDRSGDTPEDGEGAAADGPADPSVEASPAPEGPEADLRPRRTRSDEKIASS